MENTCDVCSVGGQLVALKPLDPMTAETLGLGPSFMPPLPSAGASAPLTPTPLSPPHLYR